MSGNVAPVYVDHDSNIIESFLDNLWMEYGLSENTLSAYRNDLFNLGYPCLMSSRSTDSNLFLFAS